jgi:hypothetical protein
MALPFRRWFGGAADTAEPDAAPSLRDWTHTQGWRFAVPRGAPKNGWIVQPAQVDALAWRAEWGPSQRDYIVGQELRVRAELGSVGTELQMLLIGRTLATLLEQEVYEQATEGNQTRMDDRTPEEMRWLVLFAKAPRSTLGPIGEQFSVHANWPAAGPLWVEGALAERLAQPSPWHGADKAFAIVVQRGRFVMRVGLDQPTPEALQWAVGLAGVAIASARRVAQEVGRGGIGSQRPSGWDASTRAP